MLAGPGRPLAAGLGMGPYGAGARRCASWDAYSTQEPSLSQTLLLVLCAGVPMLFGLWAQRTVSRTFERYSSVTTAGGLTGAQAAEAVLRASGLSGVSIHPVAGRLSDHYDPRKRTLNLSADVGGSSSVAALGVAAHEAGHAIQHASNYWPMQVRQTLVPAAQIGQSLWFLPVVLGLALGLTGLVNLGLVLFAAIVLFQLVTLPVEFDASRRALAALEGQGLLVGGEVDGARAVLRAAALTYVAGFVAALGQLLFFFLASRR
jgi:Zn-dependent membrane protease YugP